MRAFGRLHHLFAIVLAGLTGLVASLAFGLPAHAAGTGGISGRFTVDGAGVPGVQVAVFRGPFDGPPNVVTSIMTDSNGDYLLPGLEAGTYRVGFNFGSSFIFYPSASSLASAEDVPVGDEIVPGIDPRLPRTSSAVAGRVTDASGTALGDIDVSVYQESTPGNWRSVGLGRTTGTGDYVVSGLAPGVYRIGFTDSSRQHLPAYWMNGATSETVATAEGVVVGDKVLVSGKDVRLVAGAHVSGRVVRPDGKGIQGTVVFPERWTTGSTGGAWERVDTEPARSGVDGQFELSGLRPGQYRIVAVTYVDGRELSAYYDDPTTPGVDSLTVEAGGRQVDVDVELQRPSHISGTVARVGGGGLPNVTVAVFQRAAGASAWTRTWTAWTNESGDYDVPFWIMPGDYQLRYYDAAGDYRDVVKDVVVDGNGESVVTDVEMSDGPAFEAVTLPSVSGSPVVGGTLTADRGLWTSADLTYWYDWIADDVLISNAHGTVLEVTPELAGKTITVKVTAIDTWMRRRSATSASVTVAPSPTTTPAPTSSTPTPTPAPTTPPATTTPTPVPDVASQLADVAEDLTVKGKPVVGKTVSVKNLVAQLRTSVTYKFQWYAGTAKIKKATKASLKVLESMKGKKLKVKVTLAASGTRKVVTLNLGKVR